MQRPKFKLDADDAPIQKTAMLTDMHIQMAQELLHQQFPHFEGLLSPLIGTAKQFPVMRKDFIKVIHTGGIHWVCVSNIGCTQKNKINLYDSLFSGMSPFTKEQIAALFFEGRHRSHHPSSSAAKQWNRLWSICYSISHSTLLSTESSIP